MDRTNSNRLGLNLTVSAKGLDIMAESVKQFFDELGGKIDPAKTQGMNVVYMFDITGDGGGQWCAKISDAGGEVTEGADENANITLTATDENWLQIVSGQLNGQTAFLTGKLKIKGDMSLAMKLQSIFSI